MSVSLHPQIPVTEAKSRPVAPSLDTDQQVDNAEGRLQSDFRKSSLSRSVRLSKRNTPKAEVVRRLQHIRSSHADKVAMCCSSFRLVTCGAHTVKCYPTFRCKKWFCPDCGADRAARLSRQIEAKINTVCREQRGRLCLLTLTTANASCLADGLAKLKRDFNTFRRRKAFKDHVKGFFGGYEFTFNARTQTFHVHLHLLLLRGAFWDQKAISDLWLEVTGDSFVVDIRAVKDVYKGAKEVAKYIVKASDLTRMPDERFREAIGLKKGTRMFISGGCFYNVKVDDDDDEPDIFSQWDELNEGDPCPFCANPLFDVYLSRDEAIRCLERNTMSLPKLSPS